MTTTMTTGTTHERQQQQQPPWLKGLKEDILSDVRKSPNKLEDVPDDELWTPFVHSLAIELFQQFKSNVEKSIVPFNVNECVEYIHPILKCVILAGIHETQSTFLQTPDDKKDFRVFLERMEGRGLSWIRSLSLWQVRQKLEQADQLLTQLRTALQDLRRASLEQEKQELPHVLDEQKDIGQYMKFVNRENSISMLLRHASEQYQIYLNPSEAKSKVRWAACSGGPGLGKTTFCRKSFTKASECDLTSPVWTDVDRSEQFYEIVKSCVETGRQYRIAFGATDDVLPREHENPCMSLAYRLTQCVDKSTEYPNRSDGMGHLCSVLRTLTKGNEESMVVINFDETNYLLQNTEGRGYLLKVLAGISQFNKQRLGFIFCIMSGTWVRDLHDLLVQSSGGESPREIPLPLLSSENTEAILKNFLTRSKAQNFTSSDEISSENKMYLDYVLSVLGGIPRYIELFIFALGNLGKRNDSDFSWSTFSQSLTNDEIPNNIRYKANSLLYKVKRFIEGRYSYQFSKLLSGLQETFKTITYYSIFDHPVTHNTPIGGITVEELEKSGVIFLRTENVDGQDATLLTFPLVLILNAVGQSLTDVPALLKDFRLKLNPDENERNTLAIFSMKAEMLQDIHGCVPVNQLLPLPDSIAQRIKTATLEFENFDLFDPPVQLLLKNWDQWHGQMKENGCFVLNRKGASFADMIMVGKGEGFSILFQEKQGEIPKENNINGKTIPCVQLNYLRDEHSKCDISQRHLFVMITDKGATDEVKAMLSDNECLITHNSQKRAIGSLLAMLRLFNHVANRSPVLKRNRATMNGS
mmetsp:Transcript_45428/g.110442  ORF Transcript_45428/g.110442 Transcript_45428/m.110442 type:complete len:811 (-) Transcript_45428:427-2859(-)